jgi:hypothetical protein
MGDVRVGPVVDLGYDNPGLDAGVGIRAAVPITSLAFKEISRIAVVDVQFDSSYHTRDRWFVGTAIVARVPGVLGVGVRLEQVVHGPSSTALLGFLSFDVCLFRVSDACRTLGEPPARTVPGGPCADVTACLTKYAKEPALRCVNQNAGDAMKAQISRVGDWPTDLDRLEAYFRGAGLGCLGTGLTEVFRKAYAEANRAAETPTSNTEIRIDDLRAIARGFAVALRK